MTEFEVTNLELRESKEDGSEGAGLAHVAEGMFLLHVRELALSGEPRGGVVVLHDQGDYGLRYLDLGGELAGSRWAVALPDLRGHGESEGPRGHSWGILEVLRDMDSVLDHLAYMAPNVSKVLIGQGLGGLQVLEHAAERPGVAEAVVAIGTTLTPRFEPPQKKGGLMGMFKKLGPTSPGRLAYSVDEMISDPAEREAWKKDPLTHEVVTMRAAESAGEVAGGIASKLAKVTVPVLLIHGDDDKVASADAVRALASDNVEVRILEGAGHDVLHGPKKAEATAIIREWLDEKLPG